MTRRRVLEPYTRMYATPIAARAGDRGRVARRDDEVAGWVWVEHGATGRAGWTPLAFLAAGAERPDVVFTRDDDAIEPSVSAGEVVSAIETVADWAWCRAAGGEAGWVPAGVLAEGDDA